MKFMSDAHSQAEPVTEVDTALLDAELFVKYHAPERAIKRLRAALEFSPRSIQLRERLREVAASHKNLEEAARQCLALASLYIEREDFETAYDRLLEAKELDPRINIAAGLEAIRRSRRPDLRPSPQSTESQPDRSNVTLAGDLSAISLFDAIQVIENAKLTGGLALTSEGQSGQLLFNEGRIVDANCSGAKGEAGFRQMVEITSGRFDFQKSSRTFAINIQAASNTNLILDALRHLDENTVNRESRKP
jgi:tetratricopeptide (TPR) repeat protein